MRRTALSFWVPGIALVLWASTAAAGFPIQAPGPRLRDFRDAFQASKRVDLEVPMTLEAGSVAQARTMVKDGVIHEVAKVKADVDFDTFISRMDPADWSLNLPQRWGGDVKRLRDTRKGGTTGFVLQQERMALGIPALDMTKNTVVKVGKDTAMVRWQVTHSDATLLTLGRKTVLMDNGWISFSRTPDNKVEIVSRSAHKVTTAPSLPLEKLAPGVAASLTAASLRSYFTRTVQRYKEIGEGRRTARALGGR